MAWQLKYLCVNILSWWDIRCHIEIWIYHNFLKINFCILSEIKYCICLVEKCSQNWVSILSAKYGLFDQVIDISLSYNMVKYHSGPNNGAMKPVDFIVRRTFESSMPCYINWSLSSFYMYHIGTIFIWYSLFSVHDILQKDALELFLFCRLVVCVMKIESVAQIWLPSSRGTESYIFCMETTLALSTLTL